MGQTGVRRRRRRDVAQVHCRLLEDRVSAAEAGLGPPLPWTKAATAESSTTEYLKHECMRLCEPIPAKLRGQQHHPSKSAAVLGSGCAT